MAHVFSMKELALQAGVSLATVDRVLHQRPGVRPATQRRVQQAWEELARQQQQVGRQGQRLLIDLVMEAPTRFSRLVRDALETAMRRAQPAVLRARYHLAEALPAAELVAVLDAIGRRGSQGVLLKAPDVPEVCQAVARLHAQGIAVLTLVTDLRACPRVAYIGLDNHSAGQTAAYLLSQWLGEVPAQVLVSSSGQKFQGEEVRIEAFAQALARSHPGCQLHVLSTGLGLHEPTVSQVSQLLASQPEVAAVYSVGGANAAILQAFDLARRPCRVFIGHDLDEDNLALLRRGRLSAVLHHDLQHDLHTACQLLMQAHGGAPRPREAARSNVELITPFNLPASHSPQPWATAWPAINSKARTSAE